MEGEVARGAAGAGGGLADGRLAADPQRAGRSAGTSGTASPAGDALPPLLVEGAEVELASVRGVRTVPLGEFLVGPKRNAAEPDELITAVLVAPSGGAADVHEGRAAERDGDRRLLAGRRRRPRARRAAGGLRLRGAGRRAGLVPARRVGIASRPRRGGGEPDRRRPRHRRVPAACAAGRWRESRAGAGALER